jgi:L-ascorbate metabolism protein UlaG (beta-lactamase superfamily)
VGRRSGLDRGIVDSVTWLGHSTVLLEIAGTRLLTDPLLRPHAGLLRRRTPRPTEEHWREVDAVLLSHLHHDHAHLRSLRELGPVPILTGRENAAWLRGRDLPGVPLEGWRDVGEVSVRLVPAVHHSRPMPHRPNEAHGHLLRSESAAVWVAGDTSLYDGLQELPAWAGRDRIDVAVVPVGGWGPRLSPGHMGPEEAAVACAETGARYAVPVHWGTFHVPPTGWFGSWTRRPLELFADALARIAPHCHLVPLRAGGERSVLDL